MDFFDLPPETQAYYWNFLAPRDVLEDNDPAATLERMRLEADLLASELRSLQRAIMFLELRPTPIGPKEQNSLPETNER